MGKEDLELAEQEMQDYADALKRIRNNSMAAITLLEAVRQGIWQEMERDKSVFILRLRG
ncbi:MAG: hypothetical protein AB1757_01130 [Acidobacteriota bacterium]